MLHFLSAQLSQTTVIPDGDGNTWIPSSQTPGWHKWLFYLFSVEAVYSRRDTSQCRVTRDDSDSRLACDHEMSRCLVVRVSGHFAADDGSSTRIIYETHSG